MDLFAPTVAVAVATLLVAAGAARIRPAVAAVTLTVLGVASVVAAAGSVASVLAGGIRHTPLLTSTVGWCSDVAGTWPGQVLALGAVTLLLAGAANAARTARRQRRAPSSIGGEPLVVIDDATPAAFSLAGAGGQVVVSTGMLSCLGPAERAALFAHERAHLRHRHHLLLRLSGLAAAALPLLRPVRARVQLATERWADEAAAAEVGDRRVVATAVLRAALATEGGSLPSGGLGFGHGSVEDRVAALLRDPVDRPRAAAAAVAAAVAALGLAVTQLHHLATLVGRLC